jgi:DNA polymerase
MGSQTKSYLQELGIQPYALRVQPSKAASAPKSAAATLAELNDKEDMSQMDWETLRRKVTNCRLCGLHKTRTQAVFGVGDPHAEWLVIGEAPGADEDRQGEPFVGRAGQLLDSMLRALGLKRGANLYIANILKSRPPNNREPTPAEVALCIPYLQRQIELIQPRIILAVGRIAAQNLLQTDTPIGRMRGRVYQYGHGTAQIPVVVTYHPAYLLRSPSEKRKAWADLKFAQEVFRHGRG